MNTKKTYYKEEKESAVRTRQFLDIKEIAKKCNMKESIVEYVIENYISKPEVTERPIFCYCNNKMTRVYPKSIWRVAIDEYKNAKVELQNMKEEMKDIDNFILNLMEKKRLLKKKEQELNERDEELNDIF